MNFTLDIKFCTCLCELHKAVKTQHLIQLKVLASRLLSVYFQQNFQGCWLQPERERGEKKRRQKPLFWHWQRSISVNEITESRPSGCCTWREATNITFLSVALTLLPFFSLLLPLISVIPPSLSLSLISPWSNWLLSLRRLCQRRADSTWWKCFRLDFVLDSITHFHLMFLCILLIYMIVYSGQHSIIFILWSCCVRHVNKPPMSSWIYSRHIGGFDL